jgi:hypothetical protein
LFSNRLAVDIAFIGVVIVAIVITAFVVARAITDTFSANTQSETFEQSGDPRALPIQAPDSQAPQTE